jgi:hypothetical protein
MDRRRAKPVEVLGAWLGVWTPPRGVDIPPVPRRKLAIGGGALLVALIVAGIVLVPRFTEHQETAREREARIAAERHAETLRRADAEQRPRTASGAAAGRDLAARRQLLADARANVREDAEGRTDKRIRGMECEPFPRSPGKPDPVEVPARRIAVYQCIAVTAEFSGTAAPKEGGIIGIPFRLVLHFDTGEMAWCRVVPLGARDRLKHQPPAECQPPVS